MLDLQTWVIFISAGLALAFSPGPGMLYVLSRTLSGGQSVGVASTVGSAMGGMLHVVAAALGISAILAASSVAFSIVKYLGAIFLIYLGVKMLWAAYQQKETIKIDRDAQGEKEVRSAFYQGIISEALNPKTAVFFLAFIPQFIQPEQGQVMMQFLVLGTVVVIMNMIPDFLICGFSRPIETLWYSRPTFRKNLQNASGVCLVGLGAYLALSNAPAPTNVQANT